MPPATTNYDDSFHYTVSDGRGGSQGGTVTVMIAPSLEPSLNLTWESLTNLQVRVRGSGIPLRGYHLEFTEQLPAQTWQSLGAVTADDLGMFEYVDHPPAGSPARYYRTTCP